MDHVEKALVLHDDDAVAIGVAFGLDEVYAIGNLLAFREVVVRSVGEADGHEVPKSLEFGGLHLVGINIDLCVGERTQLAAVVGVLVREQDLGDLFGLVAEGGKSLHVAADVLAGVGRGVLVGILLGGAGGKSRIEGLTVESVFSEFYCFDFHIIMIF